MFILYRLLFGPLYLPLRPDVGASRDLRPSPTKTIAVPTNARGPLVRYYVWSIRFELESEDGDDISRTREAISGWLKENQWQVVDSGAPHSCVGYRSQGVLPASLETDLTAKPQGWNGAEGGVPTVCVELDSAEGQISGVVLYTVMPGTVAALREMGSGR